MLTIIQKLIAFRILKRTGATTEFPPGFQQRYTITAGIKRGGGSDSRKSPADDNDSFCAGRPGSRYLIVQRQSLIPYAPLTTADYIRTGPIHSGVAGRRFIVCLPASFAWQCTAWPICLIAHDPAAPAAAAWQFYARSRDKSLSSPSEPKHFRD